ncbi:hypothetical protein HCU64_06790 [Methylobacterium sp. C25]|uniref:hypothetical protein n=1 Tax=Methylobacterium sp. C25 TaxID=2721622 RepID=UPI001F29ED68|nr:hypothetical protein [Methylobacterium sp. C25]MCE4223453.1 hypothetical protein [Methylobacterium sp. C25]
MTPIIVSAVVFLALEGTAHFSRMLAFGVAIGMALTSALYLLAEPTPKEKADPNNAARVDGRGGPDHG